MLVGLGHLVDESGLQGFPGVEQPRREQHVHRPADADEAREPLGASVPRDRAAREVGESQPRARRGDANVAGERDLQALVDGVPVEDGDRRLADGGDGSGGSQIIHGARPIGPEAEGVPAPGEQDDPYVGVGIDALAGLPEL